MIVLAFLKTGIVGSDIIIMEGASARTHFVYNILWMTYGEKMVMVNSVDRSIERQISQNLNVGDNLPDTTLSYMDVDIPCRRHMKIVPSSEFLKHDGRFQVAQCKKQKEKRKETTIDLEASLLSNDDKGPTHQNSDKLPSRGQNLDSSNTDYVDNIRRTREGLDETKLDPHCVPPNVIDDVENVEEEGGEVDIGIIEASKTLVQPMSTFSILESMSLTQSENGIFMIESMYEINGQEKKKSTSTTLSQETYTQFPYLRKHHKK